MSEDEQLIETRPLRFVTLSRTAKDWTCPRSRFWGYEYVGRGLSVTGTSQALYLGSSLHDALAVIGIRHMTGVPVDIDEVANTVFKQIYEILEASTTKGSVEEAKLYANEQATLIEGLVRGYYKHVWPRLLAKYPEIVAVEEEVVYHMSDEIKFVARPDLLMADPEGGVHYIEFKSTSSKKQEWVDSWQTAVQLHSSVKAVEATFGYLPEDVTIIGFYKGYSSYGKQNSPMCYAYKKSGNPPFTKDQVEYGYKAGFKKLPVWEMEGGCKAWIESMPELVLADQFPMTPPIYVDEDMISAFFKQRLIREEEIALYDESNEVFTLDKVFPQKFEACSPAWGHECEFKKICFGAVKDPIVEGYELRVPHMEAERDQLGLNDPKEE